MLEKSFRIMKGIGEKTEKRLWDAGIKSWNDIDEKKRPNVISNNIWNTLVSNVNEYKKLLQKNDFNKLNTIIPNDLAWRAIPNYQGRIAYLDIETTGLSYHDSQITTIAVFDGKEVHTFVHGKNLKKFKGFIKKFPAIATYYGKCFDVPFINNYLGVEIPQLHFDTCFLLRKIGYSGGLKAIERKLGLSRGIMSKLDGYSAVLLWGKYKKTNDERYLETLLAYNAEDVLNLEFLLKFAYNGIVSQENFPTSNVSLNKKHINNPYKAHKEVVQEILSMNTGYGWY
ncbi:MAG: ribonuclease H-like domain-containing protein [Promethearchaeota archaeon]